MKTITHAMLVAAPLLLLTATLAAAATPAPGPMPPPENQKLAHDIFKEMVEINSVHDVGTRAVVDVLVRYLKAGGFTDAEMQVLPEEQYPHQVNLVVRLAGKGRGRP